MNGEINHARLFVIVNDGLLAFDTGRKLDIAMVDLVFIHLQYEKYDQ